MANNKSSLLRHFFFGVALFFASSNLVASNFDELPDDVLSLIFLSGYFHFFDLDPLKSVNKKLYRFLVEDFDSHDLSVYRKTNGFTKLFGEYSPSPRLPTSDINHVCVKGATVLVSHALGLSVSRDGGKNFVTVDSDTVVQHADMSFGILYFSNAHSRLSISRDYGRTFEKAQNPESHAPSGAPEQWRCHLHGNMLAIFDDKKQCTQSKISQMNPSSVASNGKRIFLGSTEGQVSILDAGSYSSTRYSTHIISDDFVRLPGFTIESIFPRETTLMVYAKNISSHHLHEFSLDDKRELRKIELPAGTTQVELSPDGTILVVAHHDDVRQLRRWNEADSSFSVVADDVSMIASLHDSTKAEDEDGVLTVTSQGLRFLVGKDFVQERTIDAPFGRIETIFAVGKAVIMVSDDHVVIGDAYGHPLRKIISPEPMSCVHKIRKLAASDDGAIILLFCPSEGEAMFSVDGGAQFARCHGENIIPYAAAVSCSGKKWFLAGVHGLLVCDDKSGNFSATALTALVASLSLSQDERTIVAGSDDGDIYISRDGGASFTLTRLSHKSRVVHHSVSRDGNRILVINGDGSDCLYDSADGGATFSELSLDVFVEAMAFDDINGQVYLATPHALFALALDKMDSDIRILFSLREGERFTSLSLSPHGQLFFCTSSGQCYRKN